MPAPGKSRSRSVKRAAPKRAAPSVLISALAEAAWAEADLALAEALSEFAGLNEAPNASARVDAMALLGQALARAARKRGLKQLGVVGAVEPYDLQRHDLTNRAARLPKHVRIVVPGVERSGEVLIRARAAAVRSGGA